MTINELFKSALGLSVILAACSAIGVGVGGGYRSPLSATADAAAADAAMVDVGAPEVRIAGLPALPPRSGSQSQSQSQRMADALMAKAPLPST